METITIYDSNHNPLSPSEINLGQIFDYEIVIIDDSIFRNTDTKCKIKRFKTLDDSYKKR